MEKENNTYLTPSEKALINLLQNQEEAHEYYNALKTVHYLATYCVEDEMVELSASRYIHDLLDIIQKIILENVNLNKDYNK